MHRQQLPRRECSRGPFRAGLQPEPAFEQVLGKDARLNMRIQRSPRRRATSVMVRPVVRFQTFIGDALWMKAMIPHHSIAILVSKYAIIKNPEVRQLADSIISAQGREIGQMKRMIARLERERAAL